MSFIRENIVPVPEDILQKIENDPDFPKGYYARDLLYGKQSLSGSDLKGKASSYGLWYAQQRFMVQKIAEKYGLRVVYAKELHGRKVFSL